MGSAKNGNVDPPEGNSGPENNKIGDNGFHINVPPGQLDKLENGEKNILIACRLP